MGKLGARELNYSSDVDLILLYRRARRARYTGRRGIQRFFSRLAHELVAHHGRAHGRGLRLPHRSAACAPIPASTPPAVSRLAALAYYESAGQNWERAALIKARPVAGDRAAGAAFLAELTPFLWRKHLGFRGDPGHPLDQAPDRRATAAAAGSPSLGHNIKLGRGGIREIEFFAQTQQLIWGGRQPELRVAGTCAALAALAAHRPRHRRGRRGDDRGLSLPAPRRASPADGRRRADPQPAGRRARAARASRSSWASPRPTPSPPSCTRQLGAVERHYARLFEEAPTLAGPGQSRLHRQRGRSRDARDPVAVSASPTRRRWPAIMRGWHHGRYRATRSQRARELLTELVPALLAAFGASPNPDAAFLRFDQFLARLPAGRAALFAVLQQSAAARRWWRRSWARDRGSPTQSRAGPSLLDGVLTRGLLRSAAAARRRSPPSSTALLDGARHYEEMLGPRPALGRRPQVPGRRPAPAPPARRRSGRRRIRRHRRGGDRRAAAARRRRVRAERTAASRAARSPCSAWASSAAAR